MLGCVCVRTCVCVSVQVHVCMNLYVCVCVRVCIYVCECVRAHTCMSVCAHLSFPDPSLRWFHKVQEVSDVGGGSRLVGETWWFVSPTALCVPVSTSGSLVPFPHRPGPSPSRPRWASSRVHAPSDSLLTCWSLGSLVSLPWICVWRPRE